MNGDQVRGTSFHPVGKDNAGYRARDVDELIRRVVAELDAGRSVGQLIKNATLRKAPADRPGR